VKICGVRRIADVHAATEAGAAYIGLVFAESPRRVDVDEAARLAVAATEAGARPVGVFVDRPVEDVRATALRAGLRVAQLHGDEPPEACRRLREAGLEVWKALRPRSRAELAEAAGRYREAADALLVEGFSPEAAGGTGTAVPREWLEGQDGRAVARPLVLAGGLDPENVADAVREARPDAVDVSSGVESAPGVKDHGLVRAFVERARGVGAGAGATDTDTDTDVQREER
jgi:phosphoribosylanthranilate isomerase